MASLTELKYTRELGHYPISSVLFCVVLAHISRAAAAQPPGGLKLTKQSDHTCGHSARALYSADFSSVCRAPHLVRVSVASGA